MAKARARRKTSPTTKGRKDIKNIKISSAIVRRARAAGKSPKRVAAALKGWDTRRKALEHAQREHGRKAREKSERALTPAQKRARTLHAKAFAKRAQQSIGERDQPSEGHAIRSIQELDDDYEDTDRGEIYDGEGHQKTTRKGKRGR